MTTLILLRHGQSTWNQSNLFTGWVDVELTDQGRSEACEAGALLAESDLLPDICHTSLLRRAIESAYLALEACDRLWIPQTRSWRLNERHYGALQGLDKADVRREYGDEQLQLWRRSYDVPPPPLEHGSEHDARTDPRYAGISADVVPDTECLADVVVRMMPYWYDSIVPDLRSGRTVLVAAHGNSLRALVKHLENISDKDIAELNIATGVPRVYELDDGLRPTSMTELGDPEAIRAAAEAVANQAKR